MKRVISVVFAVALVCSVLCAAGWSSSGTSREIRLVVQGPDGTPVDGAQTFVYAGPDQELIYQGVTSQGLVSVPLEGRNLSALRGYVDFKVHVYHPGYGLLVRTWSEPESGLRGRIVELRYDEQASTDVSATYVPSGIFRERLDPTVSPNPKYYEVLVDVYELHFLSGLSVRVDYSTGVSSSIQAGYKQTWPTATSWSVSGSVTKSYQTTSTWYSSGTTASKKCRTWFEFRDEYWVLEEEDGDIKDLWHPVKKWIETDAYLHAGGAEFGATVSGDKYDYTNVISGLYGMFFTNVPGTETTRTVSGTQTYSLAFSTPSGFSASASTTYNNALSVKWTNNSTVTFAMYDRNTSQRIWYVTSTQYD